MMLLIGVYLRSSALIEFVRRKIPPLITDLEIGGTRRWCARRDAVEGSGQRVEV